MVYQDYVSSFTELLEKDKSTTIHNRNIQLLATELFKVKNRHIYLYSNKKITPKFSHFSSIEFTGSEIFLKKEAPKVPLLSDIKFILLKVVFLIKGIQI